MSQYVYVLATSSGIYIGCSADLQKRVERHVRGGVPATKNVLPVKLLFYAAFSDRYVAYRFERYLKSGSGRAFLKKRLLRRDG